MYVATDKLPHAIDVEKAFSSRLRLLYSIAEIENMSTLVGALFTIDQSDLLVSSMYERI